MKRVCKAAKKAAKRNTIWDEGWKNYIHGLRTTDPAKRKLYEFKVSYGNGVRAFWLTSAGVLMRECSDGFIPVDLCEYDRGQLNRMEEALNRIAC